MKNNLKHVIAIILALFMVMSLSSCGVSYIDDIEADTEGDKKDVIENNADNSTPTGQVTTDKQNDTQPDQKATIAEKVCFEYDGIIVTAKEMVYDSIFGAGIKLHIENNSGKDYTISTEAVIVNNCMVSELFYCNIAAGKKANDTLYLSLSDLSKAGISNIGQIEIYFYVYNPTTYERVYETDCVTIKTSLYDKMDTTVENAGHTLYEENGIKIVGKYVDEYTILGKAVVLYIENNSNNNIGISCEDMSINGYMITGLFSETVYQGKYAVGDITILNSDLENNNIKEINEFELKFRIYNADTYTTITTTNALKFSVK